jgi:hypothetical protein
MTVPGDKTPWYQCGNPDEFVFMNPGDRLSDKRSPFMKEMTTIDGAFAYTMWEGNCDAGKLYRGSLGNTVELEPLDGLTTNRTIDIIRLSSAAEARTHSSLDLRRRSQVSAEEDGSGL